jgi:hypothetical protein
VPAAVSRSPGGGDERRARGRLLQGCASAGARIATVDTLTAQRGPHAADGSAVTDSPAGPDAPPNGAAQAPAAAQPAIASRQTPEQPLGPAGAADQTATTGSCARCGAPMTAAQDWCLQCGSGAPTALGTPGWRSTAVLAAAAGVLVLAAGGVGYAALSKGPRHAAVITRTVAQVTPPAAATPPPAATPAPTPAPKLSVPATPNIPATPVAPAAKAPAPAPPPATNPATTPAGGSTTPKPEEAPTGEPIVLDTNAATTYNPETLPAASFGDPTLAIDGDPSTGWTARVEPATAPKMSAGLLVGLNSLQRVAEIELVTATPGMTVQVYGSTAASAPATITDPGWKKLTRALVVHKRHAKLTLHEVAHGYRFILLWISRAGGASAGTPKKPGHVSVNELELFPPHH